MTKSSLILLIGIAIMIVIGASVWRSTGGDNASLPNANPVATPIQNESSTEATGTNPVFLPASSSPSSSGAKA
ncbi:MAG TPA: hypothetical protein VMT99_02330, partial [Candidatus Paceibacterota bacterium]|nr:hypothetical protein [Candidatus Paceibacterota bacterium]